MFKNDILKHTSLYHSIFLKQKFYLLGFKINNPFNMISFLKFISQFKELGNSDMLMKLN